MRLPTVPVTLAACLATGAGSRQFPTHYFDPGRGGIVRAPAADRMGDPFGMATMAGGAQTIVVTKADGAGTVTARPSSETPS